MITQQQQAMLSSFEYLLSQQGEIAIGIDMAANEKNWGICILNISESNPDPLYSSKQMSLLLPQPRLNSNGSISPTLLSRPSLELLMSILQIAAQSGCPTSIAVDVPFGWSVQQSAFLQHWSADSGLETSGQVVPEAKDFSMRLCDRELQRRHRGINPLSVGADRIAAAALKWSRVRQCIDVEYQVDLGLSQVGPGLCIFETYPGAFVRLNAVEFSDYKKKPDVRHQLVECLLRMYDNNMTPDDRESLEWACEQNGSPDALDAFLCALTAWDHLRYRRDSSSVELTTPERLLETFPDEATQHQIHREGWILIRR